MMPGDWEWIDERGEELAKHCPGDTWTGIKKRVGAGGYGMVILRLEGERAGFAVVTEDEWEDEACLLVVGFYIEPGAASSTAARSSLLNLLRPLAREQGCSLIRFRTTRRGWLRALAAIEDLDVLVLPPVMDAVVRFDQEETSRWD